MVVVRLIGGLGNQMFQYAAGRAVALRNGVQLKVDVSAFQQDAGRSYRLHDYGITGSIAAPGEVERFVGRSLRRRLSRRMQRYLLPRYRRSVFVERSTRFDPDILRLRGGVYLSGYWQSEKYFRDIEAAIRREFALRQPPDQENQKMLRLISETESVSLHVRRGDYVTNPLTYRFHGVCSPEYYRAAMEKLTESVRQPHFFVFSDAMDWARRNVSIEYPVTYVTHNGTDRDYEDLRLMSHCKHHIIANSTFSWWGAWLSESPGKLIIAPQDWFSSTKASAEDLMPDEWIRL